MNNYYFNNKDLFYTLKKDYRIYLQKTGDMIHIKREEKSSDLGDDYRMNNAKLLARQIKTGGVYNQLSNIKTIVFEVTDACNLNCTYCTYGEFYCNYDTRKNKFIDINKAKLLIDFLLENKKNPESNSLNNEVLISFYGGEPILNMDFIHEMVSYTKKKENEFVKFKYNMTTNGVLLIKYIPFFIQYNFDIMVSLDGSRENNAYRLFQNGDSSFDRTYKNMIYIRDNYPVFFERNILFNSVIHNLNNKKEVFCFFQNEFHKTPTFAKVNVVGVKPELIEQFKIMATPKQEIPDEKIENEMKRVMDLNYDKAKIIEQFIFQFSGNKYRTYKDLILRKSNVRYLSSGTCFPFSRKIFMTVNNKILPCERIGHQFSLGRVSEDGVEISCKEIARKYTNLSESLRGLCSRCYHAGFCSECMYLVKNLCTEKKLECEKFVFQSGFNHLLYSGIEQLSQSPDLYRRIMEEVFTF